MTVGGGTLERWWAEKTAAYLDSAVAAAESNPANAELFGKMAGAAEKQAGILAKDLGGDAGLHTGAPRAPVTARACAAGSSPRSVHSRLSSCRSGEAISRGCGPIALS